MSQSTSSSVHEAASAIDGPQRRELAAWQKLGVVFLVGMLALAWIWLRPTATHAHRDQDAQELTGADTRGVALAPPPPLPLAAPPPPPLPMPAPQASVAHLLAGDDDAATKALNSNIMAFSGSGTPVQVPAAEGSATGVRSIAAPSGASGDLAVRLQATTMQGAKAALLPHPDYLITEGTMIPCTLQTAIDSSLVGFVKCVLPQAVRSTTGTVTLLDRGTQVVGQVQSGLMQGQNRLFILWTRAETPDHAIISLNSPATDALGRSGVNGAVDTHFWERFGGAIMLSLLDTGLQAGSAAAANAGSSGSVNFNSFQSNGQNAAAVALGNTINIPPTLTKNEGENVAIFVARDLDFSDVYHLQAIR